MYFIQLRKPDSDTFQLTVVHRDHARRSLLILLVQVPVHPLRPLIPIAVQAQTRVPIRIVQGNADVRGAITIRMVAQPANIFMVFDDFQSSLAHGL